MAPRCPANGKVFALGGLHELSHESYPLLRAEFEEQAPTTTSFTGCFYAKGIDAIELLDDWIAQNQFRLYRASAWPHREICIFVDLPTPLLDRLRYPVFSRLFRPDGSPLWIVSGPTC